MLLECQISFGRTASGQDRRISGVEKLLHLHLFIGSGINVAMSVDESRYCAHAARIDDLHTGNIGAARRNRSDPASPNDDRTLFDHVNVTNNDPRVDDGKILGRETS